MSSMNDLLQRATELVQALTELLDSKTAQALPGVAEELGATALLNTSVDALVSVLGLLHQGLADLGETALVQLDALGGLLGMLEPLVGALGRMIDNAGSELKTYGLDQVVTVTDPVAQGFLYAEAVLHVGQSLTVDSQRLAALIAGLVALKDRAFALRTPAQEIAA